jgi:hypothetical protein
MLTQSQAGLGTTTTPRHVHDDDDPSHATST